LEAPAPPAPPQVSEASDAGVLQRAQSAGFPDAADDDPFFAELRQAMSDNSPLGPREDDWIDDDDVVDPQQTGTDT
jgi:hypothetical protein